MLLKNDREYLQTKKLLADWRENIEQQRQHYIAQNYAQDQVERALGPLLYFAANLVGQIETYETTKNGQMENTSEVRHLIHS